MTDQSDNMATNVIANNNLNIQVMTLDESNQNPVIFGSKVNYIKWTSKEDMKEKIGFSEFDTLVDIIKSNFKMPINSNKDSEYVKKHLDYLINNFKSDFCSYSGDKVGKKMYKYSNLFSFYNILLNVPEFVKILEDESQKNCWFLNILIKIDKSQHLLNYLNFDTIFKNMKDIQCAEFYYLCSILANLPTFLKVDKMLDNNIKKHIFQSSRSALSGASKNSDIRVLRYILANINTYYSADLHTNSSMNHVISGCFSTNIPKKFTFKRLKMINEVIHLAPYFENMLICIWDIGTFLSLNKYYGDEKNFSDLSYEKLFKLTFPNVDLFLEGGYDKTEIVFPSSDIKISKQSNISSVLNVFHKLEHRAKFLLVTFSHTYSFWNYNLPILLDDCPKIFLATYASSIISSIIFNYSFMFNSDYNDDKYKDVIKFLNYIGKRPVTIYVNKILSSNFINNDRSISSANGSKNILTGLFFILPFVNFIDSSNANMKEEYISKINDNMNIKSIKKYQAYLQNFKLIISKELFLVNKLLLCFKRYLRKNAKVIRFNKKLDNFNSIENDMNALQSNVKSNNISRKFNNVPPRHLMINELKQYDGKEFIIREKADGYIVDCFPNDIEPKLGDLGDYKIKAEFIEELDLYLVFDVDLITTLPICGEKYRYDFLRSSHDFTNESFLNDTLITSYDELKEHILKEKNNFEKFLAKPYTSYRYYPKGAWKIKLNKEFISALESILDVDYKMIYDGKLYYDGFIMTPITGIRELKLKPLKDQSIDLLYKSDKKFYDRDGICWDDYIDFDISILRSKGLNLVSKQIYRLIPNLKTPLKFKIDSNRFDKKKPNSNKIVNSTIGLLKYYMNKLTRECDDKNYYYSKIDFSSVYSIKRSKSWKDISDRQNDFLNEYIKKMIPERNKNWLDLGCGSLKLLKSIKRFQYNGYLGIDIDMNQLIVGLNRIDSYILKSNEQSKAGIRFDENRARIMCGNLKENLSGSSFVWDNLNENNNLFIQKFDYVVCNFSISHFMCDQFWENLNTLTLSGTKLLFNCINEKVIEKPWEFVNENGDLSFVKYENNMVKLKFEFHEETIEESYLSSSIIKNYLDKYGWEISLKSTPTGSDLESYYDWYIINK